MFCCHILLIGLMRLFNSFNETKIVYFAEVTKQSKKLFRMDTELYGLSYAFSYMRRCIYIRFLP